MIDKEYLDLQAVKIEVVGPGIGPGQLLTRCMRCGRKAVYDREGTSDLIATCTSTAEYVTLCEECYWDDPASQSFSFAVILCPRCGGSHGLLVFDPPLDGGWPATICPASGLEITILEVVAAGEGG